MGPLLCFWPGVMSKWVGFLIFTNEIDYLWVSHHAPSSHSPSHPFISTLCPCSLPLKIKHTITRTSHHRSCSVSQCVPQYIPLSTHLHLQMFIAVSHWSGSRHLASATPSILDHRWDSSLLSCVTESMQLFISRTGPFRHSNSSQMM